MKWKVAQGLMQKRPGTRVAKPFGVGSYARQGVPIKKKSERKGWMGTVLNRISILRNL